MKNIYRIEIPSKGLEGFTFQYWIGARGELVSELFDAVPCTEEEHLAVMERIGCEATAFVETGKVSLRRGPDPEAHSGNRPKPGSESARAFNHVCDDDSDPAPSADDWTRQGGAR